MHNLCLYSGKHLNFYYKSPLNNMVEPEEHLEKLSPDNPAQVPRKKGRPSKKKHPQPAERQRVENTVFEEDGFTVSRIKYQQPEESKEPRPPPKKGKKSEPASKKSEPTSKKSEPASKSPKDQDCENLIF